MTPSRRPGLAARLLVAHLLVVLTAAATAALVAAVVGPRIFHDHLGQVSAHDVDDTTVHAEEAFRDAGLVSLGVALLAALVVAALVSAYVTRRIAGPVQALATAAEEVAAGHYSARLPAPGIGAEFDSVTASFSAMAARLESVEQTRRRLLADLAHEMRTPLATIDAYLEGFEDGVATLDPDTARLLRAQTRRLTRLSEDVTAVSRAEEHQLELQPVLVAATSLVDVAARAAQGAYDDKGVQLAVDVPADLPVVQVDVDRFGQVLANLLDNALRHTAPGGRVQVRGSASAGEVVLEVVDAGSGIPAEHLPHVFERFYRVDAARDRQHGGSGIGLAIAKAVVEAHDGHIAAASDGAGRGATFTVRLPARRES